MSDPSGTNHDDLLKDMAASFLSKENPAEEEAVQGTDPGLSSVKQIMRRLVMESADV